jgi:hypothetical protein
VKLPLFEPLAPLNVTQEQDSLAVQLTLELTLTSYAPVAEETVLLGGVRLMNGETVTVMASVRGELLPQELLATTLRVPLLVGVRVQEIPVPEGVPLPEYVQV